MRPRNSFVTPLGHPLDIFTILENTFGNLGLLMSTSAAPLGTPLLGQPVLASLNLLGPCCKTIKTIEKYHFGGISFGTLLGKVAHAIRLRLCSPNTISALIPDTCF